MSKRFKKGASKKKHQSTLHFNPITVSKWCGSNKSKSNEGNHHEVRSVGVTKRSIPDDKLSKHIQKEKDLRQYFQRIEQENKEIQRKKQEEIEKKLQQKIDYLKTTQPYNKGELLETIEEEGTGSSEEEKEMKRKIIRIESESELTDDLDFENEEEIAFENELSRKIEKKGLLDFLEHTSKPIKNPFHKPPQKKKVEIGDIYKKMQKKKLVSDTNSPSIPYKYPSQTTSHLTSFSDENDFDELEPTWRESHEQNRKNAKSIKQSDLWCSDSSNVTHRFALLLGDITKVAVDGIVVLTSSKFSSESGIDAMVRRKAGPMLHQFIQKHYSTCIDGNAVITPAYKLASNYIIFTVAPKVLTDNSVKNMYRSILDLAVKYNIRSLAFPTLLQSDDWFVGLQVIYEYLCKNALDQVVFVSFSRKDYDKYSSVLTEMFDE
ncbi:Mono-ADP ribosylhydrolase 1 [Entamoeba marina]